MIRSLTCASITASFVLSILGVKVVNARPNPDRSGICYFFQGNVQELQDPCVISTGYGAGAHYAVLHWSDGVKTRLYEINHCPEQNYDDRGFCSYTVDDYEAQIYQRDGFMNPTTSNDMDNLLCFRVIKTGNSVCYRFS